MESSEDCCEVWPKIRPNLKWFEFVDERGVLAMPCITSGNPHSNWRVNYCPICGSERRDAIWNIDTDPVDIETHV